MTRQLVLAQISVLNISTWWQTSELEHTPSLEAHWLCYRQFVIIRNTIDCDLRHEDWEPLTYVMKETLGND